MGRVTPVPAQPFFHFRRITLNPAVNRGVIDIHSAFSQHLLQLTVTDAVFAVPAYGPQNDVTLKMPAFEWVHVQLHQQKGMISLSPPTICNSADNNAAERALRAVCLGKKNYVFFGSDHGGERGALLYGLIGTCRLNGIDPEAYLRHILGVLPEWPSNRVDELLPWNVALTNK
ncbi:IS66 family transposase [Salmonella enterica subsp. enterica serovar Typhimurium]|nr:IS66 family transposase [Salmonella enterica subsp. enterica serovar Typhimurium]